MLITTAEIPDIIELEKTDKLIVSNTIVMASHVFNLSNYKNIKLKIYDNFFLVEAINKNGEKIQKAFSDTWGFHIDEK